MTDIDPYRLGDGMAALKPKDKEPNSIRVLNSWIAHAEQALGDPDSGRISWLIATTVVAAKLQQVVDEQRSSRFLLKGGTMLQHRLGLAARATKDLDAIVRGDILDFLSEMDKVLTIPWGPISFKRGEIEEIRTPARIIKPRRFDITLTLRDKTWRRVRVEISPDEGLAGSSLEPFPAPSLAGFGIPTPDSLMGLTMSYQIAQKIHASSDPHKPPTFVNERARDVVDLILLHGLAEETGEPGSASIRSAIEDIFTSRAAEAKSLKRPERLWPARVSALSHWVDDYKSAAEDASVSLSLEEAVTAVNQWLDAIDASTS